MRKILVRLSGSAFASALLCSSALAAPQPAIGPVASAAVASAPLVPVTARNPLPTDDYTAGYYPPSSVDELALTNVGAGCTSTPTLVIDAPTTGGVQAIGHLVMNGAVVLGAVLDNPGSNYLAVPAVTLTGGGCTTAPTAISGLSQVGAFWSGPGGLYQMAQASAGAAVWIRQPAPALPLDSVINPVSAATPVAGGTGYAVNDTIALANGTVLKVATISSAAVATVTVQTAGAWPCLTASAGQAQVSTSGSGTGATFALTIAGAQGAYATKLLTACYTANKALDLVRASDSVVQTIGFVRGALDTSSAQQFCSQTTCFVSRVYDQSGNGNDATQTTPANRPVFDFNWQIGGVPGWFAGSLTIPTTVSLLSTSESLLWLGINSSYTANGSAIIRGGYLSAINQVNAGYSFAGAYAPVGTSIYPAINPTLVSTSVSGLNFINFSANDLEAQCASNCTGSGTTTGGAIGAGQNAVSMAIVSSRAYSTAERGSLKAASYVLYGISPQVRDTIVFSGDSRTGGVNSTDLYDYPAQVNTVSALPLTVFNTGISGDTTAQRVSRFYAADAPPLLQAHGKNNWIVMWVYGNDAQQSIPLATSQANIAAYTSMAHSLGFKVAFVLENNQFPAINPYLTANTFGADAIIPQVFADPVWSNLTATPQPFSGTPHPTTYGYGYVAADIAAGLLPLLH